MFDRARRRQIAAALAGTAGAPPPAAPPDDPVALMHADLARLGFVEEVSGGVHCFTLPTSTRLAIVMNAAGNGMPTPDDWSVGLYDTTSAAWPEQPTRAVVLYARNDLLADYTIVMMAVLAQLPKGN